MSQRTLAFALIAGLLAAGTALAGWTKAANVAQATFKGSGPGGFKIEGKTPTVDVKDDGKTFSVVVGLKGLDTGISLRDKHMKEKYLEVEKFPEAVLTIPVDALKAMPEAGKSGEGDLKGNFALHGVTKEWTFHYKATCKADATCDIEGTMAVNIKDHGIEVPKYLGVTVKPDITVAATFAVKRP